MLSMANLGMAGAEAIGHEPSTTDESATVGSDHSLLSSSSRWVSFFLSACVIDDVALADDPVPRYVRSTRRWCPRCAHSPVTTEVTRGSAACRRQVAAGFRIQSQKANLSFTLGRLWVQLDKQQEQARPTSVPKRKSNGKVGWLLTRWVLGDFGSGPFQLEAVK